MAKSFEVTGLFLVPVQTAAGVRYHFKFSTKGFELGENDRIAIPAITFFAENTLKPFAYFMPQEEFILGPGGLIQLEFMAVPTDPNADAGDLPLSNIRAEVKFSGPGDVGEPQPLGNLKPQPATYFITTGRHQPPGSTGRYRYTFTLTVLDDNNNPVTFLCTGVKDFTGDPEFLCGTDAHQTSPGNAAFTDNKVYPDNVGSGEILWTASTSNPNNCP